MPSELIKVTGGIGKDTRIIVRDWPDRQAPFRVRSADDRGRTLHAVGWGNFDPDCVLGTLDLHVSDHDPLMIVGNGYSGEVIEKNRPYVLASLVLCAQAIARELHEQLSVGNGCLMWQLDFRQFGEIRRRFDYFEVVGKRRSRLLPGKRYLRWCP